MIQVYGQGDRLTSCLRYPSSNDLQASVAQLRIGHGQPKARPAPPGTRREHTGGRDRAGSDG
jgi:hypothetical protein